LTNSTKASFVPSASRVDYDESPGRINDFSGVIHFTIIVDALNSAEESRTTRRLKFPIIVPLAAPVFAMAILDPNISHLGKQNAREIKPNKSTALRDL
jgi:hypothetical protein